MTEETKTIDELIMKSQEKKKEIDTEIAMLNKIKKEIEKKSE